MKLSVIILNYNVRYFLELCLKSVEAAITDIDAEIIVVDNNSPDDSCKMVTQLFPSVKLIDNKVNSGFSKGNNIGVGHAKGEYLCILNPDTVVAEDTFTKLIQFTDSKINLGIGASTLDNWVRKYKKEQQGVAPAAGLALTDEQRELQELRKQVKRLTMERDILKKASALLALDSLNGYR